MIDSLAATPSADTPAPPALEATRLRVRFDPLTPLVLHGVSLEIIQGEITCVIGPNGAGKTTLLRLLAGCLFKTRNHIKVFGRDRWRDNFALRQESTFVPADPTVAMGTAPLDHWKIIARAYGMEQEAFETRCRRLVADMNFEEHVPVPWEHLSLGLAHKALLIGGFLPPARLRILDEPVASGIDPMGMEVIGDWMKEARGRGETIVFSTQVLDRAHLLADRLLILGEGSVAFSGTPAELIARFGLSGDDPYALNRAFMMLFDKGGAPA